MCESESLSYLDDVSSSPGSLDLAKSVALEVSSCIILRVGYPSQWTIRLLVQQLGGLLWSGSPTDPTFFLCFWLEDLTWLSFSLHCLYLWSSFHNYFWLWNISRGWFFECTKRDGNLNRDQLYCPQPLGSLITSRLQTAFMQVTVVHFFVFLNILLFF